MSENYEPFGKGWEKEMFKLTKKQLIVFLRETLKKNIKIKPAE